jgi:hypothetical protein
VQEFASFHAPRVKHQAEEGQRFFGFASAGEPVCQDCRFNSRTAMSGAISPQHNSFEAHLCSLRADASSSPWLEVSGQRFMLSRDGRSQAVSAPSVSE